MYYSVLTFDESEKNKGLLKTEEARSSKAWKAKVRGPKGRGGGEVPGQGAASSPPRQL